MFRVGSLENDAVQWREVDQETSTNMRGLSPSVAINEKNNIFSVHYRSSKKLHMNCGVLSSETKKIEWHEPNGQSFNYGVGSFPSIALTGEDTLIRINTEGFWENQMVYDIGNLVPMTK